MQICDPRRCIPNAFPTAGAYGSLSLLIQCRSTAARKCFGVFWRGFEHPDRFRKESYLSYVPYRWKFFKSVHSSDFMVLEVYGRCGRSSHTYFSLLVLSMG